jgi:hypothetical protein
MAKSIPGQLSMFNLWNSEDLPNAIFSPESVDGGSPCVLQDGPTTGKFGQDRAHASRSRPQARVPVQTIQGTCGPTSIASSPPSGPLSSWENRLRDRLAMVGSTEFELIWKEQVTPAGQSIFRLSRSTPRTFASDSTGLPATWPTPLQQDCRVPATPESAQRKWDHSNLRGIAAVTTWPTPRASDEKNGNGKTGNRTPEAAHKAGWTLPELTKATWPTPITNDATGSTHCYGAMQPNGQRAIFWKLPGAVKMHLVSGPTTSGSPDQTGKPGALNPAFPCWLMGYPTVWDACAPTVMPSSRKSRQKL